MNEYEWWVIKRQWYSVLKVRANLKLKFYSWQDRKLNDILFLHSVFTLRLVLIPKMKCSGSTIVGVGSPDPPQFVYDDEEYKDVFLSGK